MSCNRQFINTSIFQKKENNNKKIKIHIDICKRILTGLQFSLPKLSFF